MRTDNLVDIRVRLKKMEGFKVTKMGGSGSLFSVYFCVAFISHSRIIAKSAMN